MKVQLRVEQATQLEAWGHLDQLDIASRYLESYHSFFIWYKTERHGLAMHLIGDVKITKVKHRGVLQCSTQGSTTPSPTQPSPSKWPLATDPCPRHLYSSRTTILELLYKSSQQQTMDRLSRLYSCMLLVLLLPLASALKFDLHPVSQHDAAKYERCVRNFVAHEQLVVVTAILDGYRGDGQRVDMHVRYT
jgi:hypothetical protein